jgi:cytochrome c oxidase subunit 3
MVSMVMLFAGLTSAYLVKQADTGWIRFDLPSAFYISTVLILLSSITKHYALVSIKKRGDTQQLLIGLLITLGLGLGFCFTQFLGWIQLVNKGIFFVGHPSGSFLYVITGLHLAHLIGGLIYLNVVIIKTLRGCFTKEYYLPVSLCSIYWHFLDILWVYLFFFLLIIR